MTTYDDVCSRWVQRQTGQTSLKQLQTQRVYAQGDILYSYGSHFELARALRNRAGDVRLWLLNGAYYSSSTTHHQGTIRSAIRQHGGDIPSLIVPFPALDAAGIDRASIEPVQVKPDRHLARLKVTTTAPRMAHYEDGQLMLPDYWNRARGTDDWTESEHQVARRVWRNDDGTYEYVEFEHVLGESLVRAQVEYTLTCRKCSGTGNIAPVPAWEEFESWVEWSTARDKVRCVACDGAGTLDRKRWAHFLSSFDYQERRPLYFFCELPNQSARTVGEALEILKPPTVKAAEMMGRTFYRQGDIFAVETTLDKRTLRKQGATFEPAGMLLGTNHCGTEVARLPDGTLLARGTLRHVPEFRDADHKRVKLGAGKSWCIIVKNTVPVSR